MSDRPCTCHPDDNPPVPCPQKYALSECKAASAPDWRPVPPRACIKPTHEAADAFWKYWRENGETHKHGYYESTWGAINAALACGYAAPPLDPEGLRLLLEARSSVEYWTPDESNATESERPKLNEWYRLRDAIDAYLAKYPDSDSVRMPTSKAHAELMIRLGSIWLEQNYAAGG